MAWYYILEGGSKGPVEAAELQTLLQNRVISTDTLVWTEGMAEWMPLQNSHALTSSTAVLAGIGSRIAAGIIDWLLVLFFGGGFVLFVFLCTATLVVRHSHHEIITLKQTFGYKLFLFGLFFCCAAFYEIAFVAFWRATPGKLMLGSRVATAKGDGVPFIYGLIRGLAKVPTLYLLLIGFLPALWDNERRALYDRVCNTRVVMRAKKQP